MKKIAPSPLALIRPEVGKLEPVDGLTLAKRYEGLKEWGWYMDDIDQWRDILSTQPPVKALEVGRSTE